MTIRIFSTAKAINISPIDYWTQPFAVDRVTTVYYFSRAESRKRIGKVKELKKCVNEKSRSKKSRILVKGSPNNTASAQTTLADTNWIFLLNFFIWSVGCFQSLFSSIDY